MLDDDSSGLGVDFTINPAESFEQMAKLLALMSSAEGKILASATKIEGSTSYMVKLDGPAASVKQFATTATREMNTVRSALDGAGVSVEALARVASQAAGISIMGPATSRDANTATREINRTEKQIERLIFTMDREAAAVGKTREQLRDQRIETLALTASELKLGEANDRLLASARNLQAVRDAQAQDRDAAATAAEAAAARERASAEASVNAQLLEQSRLEAALRRTNGADRPRATDAGASFSALSVKFAEDEARAARAAAAEIKQLGDEHERLVALVRGSQAAQQADAIAAERLRASTDPLYSATKRLNAEIAESTRLYHAGATAPGEYARQQDVLNERLRQSAIAHEGAAGSMRKSGGALKNIAVQLPDITQGLLTGQKPMQVLIQQGAQIFQVAQMAEGGLKGFAAEVGGLALAFLPVIAGVAVAGVALYRWKEQINEDAGMKKFADGLGLTHKEMKKLGDVSVSTGDIVAGVWKTISDGLNAGGSGKSIMDYLFSPNDAQQVQGFLASIYGFFTGTYAAIVDLWGSISSTVSDYVSAAAKAVASFFAPVVGAAQWAGTAISQTFSSIYDTVAGWLKSIGSAISTFAGPVLKAMGWNDAAEAVTTAGSKLGSAFGKGYKQGVDTVVGGSNKFVADSATNAIAHAQDAYTKKANAIKADRTPKKTPVDRHAESLVRDAEAIEAQIRNLYKLADAYGVSGAAALIAEARVKAESKAIKQQADIEASVDRQVRLAIAQRVSDAAKSTAGAREQAAAQAAVNSQVAAGLVPASRAADLVRDQIADLPLLAAIEAARTRGLTTEADRATKALAGQRTARAALTKAERDAQFNTDMATGGDRLDELREEQRLIGATDDVRVRALATLKATQEATAKNLDPTQAAAYIAQQVKIADQGEINRQAQDAWNASLTATADLFDTIDQTAQRAAQGMSDAFGNVGTAIGDALTVMTGYYADQAKLQEAHDAAIRAAGEDQQRIDRENRLYSLRSSSQQIGAFGDMASAAKGFFKEGSQGYKTLETAEKAFRLVQFALSVRAIAQDAIETGTKIANSVARIAVGATEAVVNAIKSLPFPLNLAAGAATVAALASIGVSIAGSFGGGGKNTLAPTNSGTGTVLGDTSAKSDSIKNAIDALKEVDTVTNTFAREMAASLKSIDSQIGGVASLVVRSGNIDASSGVTEGFKANAIGSVLSKIPVIGGILGGLFGSKTSVIGTGLYGGAQSVGDILGGGFDASYYSDIEKKKKLFGLTTSTKYSTQYSGADAGLENQFTLILKSFNDAIAAAAGPLGVATGDVQARLNGFIVDIGKIDLKGLTGAQIEEKLSAVFGAAADGMAAAAFPGLEQFQKVGEGVFETLVRVASTIEAVGTSLTLLGTNTQTMGIGVKLALADQFDSVSALTDAAGAYFETFYSKEEQAAAKTAQMNGVFASLGVAMPGTLAAFRQLVEAQDLTTAAGQSTYATLLKLAPAFADLQASMEGAKSAADIASERQDLQRQLLELQGDTAAIRALDLAKLDSSNRALQEQIYAIQDAQAAATAAKALADAWTSVGDSIMDEVKRIRGLTDAAGGNSFASLQGQFNAATAAARGGDQDAAKSLPALSQALLTAAGEQATSRQELARVQAQTAASLEATYGFVTALTKGGSTPSTASARGIDVVTASQPTTAPAPANDDLASEIKSLREEVTLLRTENNSGHAATAGSTTSLDRRREAGTAPNGGEAISVASAA